MRVIGICGSLRAASTNRGLLRAAQELAPAGMAIEVAEIGDLPLMNEDLEKPSWPEPVVRLRRQVWAADGILFACPEYNYGIPAPLKNAVDWVSRAEGIGGHTAPEGESRRNPFADRPCAIIGASAGMGGTIRGQLALRQSLQACGALTMPGPEAFVAQARNRTDANGDLTDESSRQAIQRVLAAFAAWIERQAAARRI